MAKCNWDKVNKRTQMWKNGTLCIKDEFFKENKSTLDSIVGCQGK